MSDPSSKDLRAALVRCALELLHRDHPEDLSIREVARRAGVSSGAPYHHFGDKPGLLASCAEVGWRELIARIDAVDPSRSTSEQLAARAHVYLAYAFEQPGCYRLMMSRLFYDAERFPQLLELRSQAIAGVLALIARVVGPAEVKSRGVAVWSMLHGFAVLRLDGSAVGAPDPDAQVDAIVRQAVRLALTPV